MQYKISLFIMIFLFLYGDENFNINNKLDFQSDLVNYRAKYQQNRSEHKTKKKEEEIERKVQKIFLNKNQFQLSNKSSYTPQTTKYEGLLKNFDNDSKDKLFQKLLIKNRSKKNPEKYHYTVVKKRSELKRAGVTVGKKSKVKKVYNYVEVKNTFGKKKNIGIEVEEGSKVKEIVNIVSIKHSKILEDNVNTGIRIKNKKVPKKISNSVELKNSKIGDW